MQKYHGCRSFCHCLDAWHKLLYKGKLHSGRSTQVRYSTWVHEPIPEQLQPCIVLLDTKPVPLGVCLGRCGPSSWNRCLCPSVARVGAVFGLLSCSSSQNGKYLGFNILVNFSSTINVVFLFRLCGLLLYPREIGIFIADKKSLRGLSSRWIVNNVKDLGPS